MGTEPTPPPEQGHTSGVIPQERDTSALGPAAGSEAGRGMQNQLEGEKMQQKEAPALFRLKQSQDFPWAGILSEPPYGFKSAGLG